MDARRFDALTRALSSAGNRRGLLSTLLTLAGVGGLQALLTAEETGAKGRRKRRKKRHKHGKGNGRHRKGKRNRGCKPKSRAKICANRCGIVKNKKTCKKRVNCGVCACGDVCAEGCPYPTIQEAIDDPNGPETIQLCAQTYDVPATVDITRNLILLGAGAGQTTLNGPGTERVLEIAGGAEVTLQALTVTGGDGGIYNDGGTLTLREVTVSGNEGAISGGGIYNEGGTLTLEAGSRVSGNRARFGAGFFNDGGTIELRNDSVVGGDSPGDANTATDVGGGIYNLDGTLAVQDGSRVTGNEATNQGGGIYNLGGMVTVQPGADVCNNSAPQCFGVTDNCPNPTDGICLI